MKTGKCILSALIVISMGFGFVPLTFAAGSISLVYDGNRKASIKAIDMIGLKCFDLIMKADSGVVIKNVRASGSGDQCNSLDNPLTTEFRRYDGAFSGCFDRVCGVLEYIICLAAENSLLPM